MKSQDHQERMFCLVEEYLKSGETKTSFCKTHQIKIYNFNYWQKKYNKLSTHPSQGKFIELKKEHKESESKYEVLIKYPNGISVQTELNLTMIKGLYDVGK